MMKLMGWSGGSLGAKSDGISEPIAPNLKQVKYKLNNNLYMNIAQFIF